MIFRVDANGVLVTVLAVTAAVIISILLTVMCVDEVKKSKKKKRRSAQSTHSIEQERPADPQPASVAPSTYIDINIVDAKANNTSPLPSPSVTSVQSNFSIRSIEPQPLSNDITNDFAGKEFSSNMLKYFTVYGLFDRNLYHSIRCKHFFLNTNILLYTFDLYSTNICL